MAHAKPQVIIDLDEYNELKKHKEFEDTNVWLEATQAILIVLANHFIDVNQVSLHSMGRLPILDRALGDALDKAGIKFQWDTRKAPRDLVPSDIKIQYSPKK